MLCQVCGKNNATTHIKTVINGKVTEQNLCGYCAAKKGYSSFSGSSISGLLSSMLGNTVKTDASLYEKHCQNCGTSFANIAETGKVGCAECYKVFEDELYVYLKRIHGSVKHTGKTPGRKELVVAKTTDRISELKIKLTNLVAEEKYEEAAVVRDQIKKLEEEK
ncbi:MAG: UvrB/UvrC motif-containing protein [Clostridia bacterium]|nr:UvrB/UvrC motif-containing protein [Clostridia bacterium]